MNSQNLKSHLNTQLNAEKQSALILLICALVALAWANSPWSLSYSHFWNFKILGLSLRHAVNDGWMTLFFFLVGLELKRELMEGELASRKSAALPLISAFGGMVVPGLIYLSLNWNTSARTGWGIPMATDIAFALGALAIFGRRLPTSLRVFLAALAVLDDLGSILIIALFYTQKVSIGALCGAFLLTVALGLIANRKTQRLATPLFIGLVLWFTLLQSGIQPTLAGVLTAFAIPIQFRSLGQLERSLRPWVNYAILPAFAIANAGISFSTETPLSLTHPICMGVLFGLAVGKPVGITLFAYLGVKSNLTHLPRGAHWRQILGIGCLAGIGFTVSLFISQLTFPEDQLLSEAKLGIIAASLVATTAGALILKN